MYASVLPSVCKQYGLSIAKILPVQKGYRNESYPVELKNGEVVNVLFFKREPGMLARISRADEVSEYLAGHGLPARRRYDTRTLQVKTLSSQTYVQVYNYLPGATIPWEAYTKNHIKLLGKTMSDMHAALHTAEYDTLPTIGDEYSGIADSMRAYFEDSGVKNAMINKLDLQVDRGKIIRFKAMLVGIQDTLFSQPLHMDFVRGNVLFDSTGGNLVVSGLIDFEKTALGNPIVDIARTLAFLLVDCKYKPSEKVYKYFLYTGYNKLGQSNLTRTRILMKHETYDLLEQLVIFFLTHDFYKFLKHNPYEQLSRNEHFVRTRDMLHNYNMINYIHS